LFEKYQCVYLDVAVPSSKRLIESFAITAGKGVVLSDRTGDYQTFHHDGDLSAAELTVRLQKHFELAAAAPAESYVDLTAANFAAEVLESKQPVLVDFHADWCGPCQRMGPVVVALGADFRGRAKVAKLNTDQNRALVAKYGVSAIPAFLIFQDGQVVDRVVGATSQAALANRLNAVLKE
jgi:thioredoxin 1